MSIKRLIIEIHRRSLWQVLSIYLVGSWIGYQVVLNLTQGLGMPDWVPGLAVVLFVIGLPIVLATAFVQEGLPGSAAAAAQRHEAHTGSAVEANAPAPAGPRAHALTWQRAVLAGVVAFLLLGLTAGGYMGLRNAGIGPFGSLVAAGRIDDQERILIADFHSPAGDTLLAAVITEAFRIDFARSTLVRAVEPVAVRDVLRRMDRGDVTRLDPELAREVAIRAGINALITGEVTAAGSGYVLSVRLIAPHADEVLAALRETARSADELIPAIDRLSRGLRERIGESLRDLRRAEPLAQVTTASLDALEKYTQAVRAAGWLGDTENAERLQHEAIALDTAFAAAYFGIAVQLSNRGETERALAMLDRTFRFENRLTDTQRGIAYGMYHLLRREYSQGAAALERVLVSEPHNYSALNNLGHMYVHMGDYPRAEHMLRRAVAADTARFFSYLNLAEVLVKQRQFDDAALAFASGLARAPTAAWAILGQASLPRASGDYASAEMNLHRLLDDPESRRAVREWAEFDLVLLLVARGRLAEAERRTELSARAAGGNQDVELRLALRRARDETFVRDRPDRARAALAVPAVAAAIDAAHDTTLVIEIAGACAWAGDRRCAQDALTRVGHGGPPPAWSSFDVLFAHAGIAFAAADYDVAVRHLRTAATGTCPSCEAPFIARIFERAGAPDSVLAAYTRFVDAPSMQRLWVEHDLARAHRRLGELYEERGDRAAAATHYARFVELWSAADPGLQPLVAEGRRRLAGLVAER